jgi:hypothetical protein
LGPPETVAEHAAAHMTKVSTALAS